MKKHSDWFKISWKHYSAEFPFPPFVLWWTTRKIWSSRIPTKAAHQFLILPLYIPKRWRWENRYVVFFFFFFKQNHQSQSNGKTPSFRMWSLETSFMLWLNSSISHKRSYQPHIPTTITKVNTNTHPTCFQVKTTQLQLVSHHLD